MVELMAAYSPPMPAPVSARNTTRLAKFHENAVASVAEMYTPSVMKNSLRRPSRSVSQPKSSAPSTAPARYALLAMPTCALVSRNAGLCLSAPATAPASVTSSPSSSHVMPNAMTTRVWKRLQGRRSSRPGRSEV